MTPFIATATAFGRELAVRLFDAKQKEDFRELADEMMAVYGPGLDAMPVTYALRARFSGAR